MPGLTPRGVTELFKILDRDSSKCSFKVELYMLELYCDDLQDLLVENPKGQKNVSGLQQEASLSQHFPWRRQQQLWRVCGCLWVGWLDMSAVPKGAGVGVWQQVPAFCCWQCLLGSRPAWPLVCQGPLAQQFW